MMTRESEAAMVLDRAAGGDVPGRVFAFDRRWCVRALHPPRHQRRRQRHVPPSYHQPNVMALGAGKENK